MPHAFILRELPSYPLGCHNSAGAAKGIYLAGLLLDCKPSKLRSVQFLAFRVGFLLGWARVLCNLEDVYTKSGGSVLPLLTGNVGVLTTTYLISLCSRCF